MVHVHVKGILQLVLQLRRKPMPLGRIRSERAPPTSELQRGNAVPAVNRNLQYSHCVDRRVSRQPFCLMYCISVGGLWFDFMVQVGPSAWQRHPHNGFVAMLADRVCEYATVNQ